MVCMPVGRRVQTCLTSLLERVQYTAHTAIWNTIVCAIYGARRRQSAKGSTCQCAIQTHLVDSEIAIPITHTAQLAKHIRLPNDYLYKDTISTKGNGLGVVQTAKALF